MCSYMYYYYLVIGKVMNKIGILGVMDEEVVLLKVLLLEVKEV